MEETVYQQIDHNVKLDVTKLPKVMQNSIKQLEEYDKNNEWVMYDGLAGALEATAKSELNAGYITESQFNKVLDKYCQGGH